MAYGPNFPDMFRRSADYVDKILRGAKPADIPVEQPTKFDLVVNLTTAKTHSAYAARSRRRGNRVRMPFAADLECPLSRRVSGVERTCRGYRENGVHDPRCE
jgi:hypothetical protein